MKRTWSEKIRRAADAALHNKSFVMGLVLIGFLLIIALFPQLFTSYDPTKLDPSHKMLSPSAEHLFGTDNYGRDVFARCIYATRVDLQVGFFSAIVPFAFGTVMGILAGYYGKWVDMVVMRFLDVVMALPFTILVVAIMAVLGNGIRNMYIAIWIIGWVTFTKLVRAEVLVMKNSEFLMALRISGFSDMRIIFRHILPNAVSSAIVYLASYIVMCMLTCASLSFLGLGVQPPTPEWGSLMNDGRAYLAQAPWITCFPGIFIAVAGVGFSLLGDGMSDFLRARGR
ncbi:MAG: ABC transporter permease [Eubacteriales bacterium]|nr:ABC transporter permease [Eubacteriales bacterium]